MAYLGKTSRIGFGRGNQLHHALETKKDWKKFQTVRILCAATPWAILANLIVPRAKFGWLGDAGCVVKLGPLGTLAAMAFAELDFG